MPKQVTRLHYYLRNNGDGSACIMFCESPEIAEILAAQEPEGMCDAVDYIDLEAESPIGFVSKWNHPSTVEEIIKEVEEDDTYYCDDRDELLSQLKELQTSQYKQVPKCI